MAHGAHREGQRGSPHLPLRESRKRDLTLAGCPGAGPPQTEVRGWGTGGTVLVGERKPHSPIDKGMDIATAREKDSPAVRCAKTPRGGAREPRPGPACWVWEIPSGRGCREERTLPPALPRAWLLDGAADPPGSSSADELPTTDRGGRERSWDSSSPPGSRGHSGGSHCSHVECDCRGNMGKDGPPAAARTLRDGRRERRGRGIANATEGGG